MAEDRVCQGYKVIKSRRIKTVEVVLAYNPNDVAPYVTWKSYAHTQFKNFAYGNYIAAKEKAEQDFERRVAEAREDQGLPPPFSKPKRPKRDGMDR